MKKAAGFLIIAAALAVFGYFWWQYISTPPASAEQIVPPVTVQTPTQQTLRRELSLAGTVAADNSVTVLPKVTGELSSIRVAAGDRVQAGQVVATINDEQYAPRLAEAEAALTAARSSFRRAERLVESGSATERELEQARARFESAQSQRRLAALQLQYTEIKAPIAGTVLRRNASVGQTATPQTPVVTIATAEALEVSVDVPEEYYAELAGGDVFGVEVGVPAIEHERIAARLESVAPYVSARTKSFEITVRITAAGRLVRPGMYADVYIVLSQISAPAVPIDALVGGSRLWYVDAERRARRLTLESPQSGEAYVAVPPEHAGRSFIVEGQHFLRDGQEVRPIEASVSDEAL